MDMEAVHGWLTTVSHQSNKKADVAVHPKAIRHVGLLFNEPTGRAGLFFI
jgi:hypothetical protein